MGNHHTPAQTNSKCRRPTFSRSVHSSRHGRCHRTDMVAMHHGEGIDSDCSMAICLWQVLAQKGLGRIGRMSVTMRINMLCDLPLGGIQETRISAKRTHWQRLPSPARRREPNDTDRAPSLGHGTHSAKNPDAQIHTCMINCTQAPVMALHHQGCIGRHDQKPCSRCAQGLFSRGVLRQLKLAGSTPPESVFRKGTQPEPHMRGR